MVPPASSILNHTPPSHIPNSPLSTTWRPNPVRAFHFFPLFIFHYTFKRFFFVLFETQYFRHPPQENAYKWPHLLFHQRSKRSNNLIEIVSAVFHTRLSHSGCERKRFFFRIASYIFLRSVYRPHSKCRKYIYI